jgi:apolipoprotein N-acyltransferase
MVRMRAIENGRWVLRATNTGITAAIDPDGRITATLPRHIRSSIDVHFAYRDGLTFYTRHGDWFAWLCAVVTIALLLSAIAGHRRSLPNAVN